MPVLSAQTQRGNDEHQHDLTEENGAGVPVQVRRLLVKYMKDPNMGVRTAQIWELIDEAKIKNYEPSKKNKEQVRRTICLRTFPHRL